jgi:transcriptional regulator with XRE-family HTH domain
MTSASEFDRPPQRGAPFDSSTETFGDRLAVARRATGLSRGELADKLAVKARTVKAWERNELEPRPDKTTKLAGLLNVSLKWLLTGDDAERQGPTAGMERRSPPPGSIDLQGVLTELRAIRTEQAGLAERLARLDVELQGLSDSLRRSD